MWRWQGTTITSIINNPRRWFEASGSLEKVILLGYGCGLLFGLGMRYLVFKIEKQHVVRKNWETKLANEDGWTRTTTKKWDSLTMLVEELDKE